MKIAVCVQLFYPDMFDIITSYLNNLKHPYKLYITLTNGFYNNSDIEKIKNYKPDSKIIFVENKGVDIGAFLKTIPEIDNDTDLILKLHTKKGVGSKENPSLVLKKIGENACINHSRDWFHNLLKGVLSDEKKVNSILERFSKDKQCGMVGFRLYNNSSVNKNEILKLSHLFGIDESYLNNHFIGGTMFWVRFEILKKYFTPEVINKIMENTNPGYVSEPSTMHAIERIFGYLISKENKSIVVI